METVPISSGPIVVTPRPAVLHMSPLGFFIHAREFLDASTLLSEKRGRTTFVAAFLSCRAIELGLKAFLLATGDSVKKVKRLNHNLARALDASYDRGLAAVVELTASERELLTSVNPQYMAQTLAYWDLFSSVAAPKNSDLHALSTIGKKLLDRIEPGCYAATDGVWTPLTGTKTRDAE